MSWNKSTENTTAGINTRRRKSPSIVSGVLAGIVIVIPAIIFCLYLFSSDDEEVTNRVERKINEIQEATPELTPTIVEKIEKPKEIPYWERDTTNGLTFRQLMKWKIHHRPPAAYTNNSSQAEAPPAYAIFEHQCDNAMAALLTMPPGSTAVGDPGYERWFTRDFLKSLESPIVVTKDDTPEQAQLKRDMIQVKIDLKARYDAGEDIAEIMTQTRREMQLLAIYKNEIEVSFREMINKPGITDEDYEDCLNAANIMLDSKGIAPFTPGPIAKRRLIRNANQLKKEY